MRSKVVEGCGTSGVRGGLRLAAGLFFAVGLLLWWGGTTEAGEVKFSGGVIVEEVSRSQPHRGLSYSTSKEMNQ